MGLTLAKITETIMGVVALFLLIANSIKAETACDFKNTRFISIISDGSTDRSISETRICWCEICDNEGHLQNKLADIVDLEHGNAEGVKMGS